MIWKKRLGGGRLALLLMNNKEATADVQVDWAKDLPSGLLTCPSDGCRVRDVHARKELGRFKEGFSATLLPHDSAFVVVQGEEVRPTR